MSNFDDDSKIAAAISAAAVAAVAAEIPVTDEEVAGDPDAIYNGVSNAVFSIGEIAHQLMQLHKGGDLTAIRELKPSLVEFIRYAEHKIWQIKTYV